MGTVPFKSKRSLRSPRNWSEFPHQLLLSRASTRTSPIIIKANPQPRPTRRNTPSRRKSSVASMFRRCCAHDRLLPRRRTTTKKTNGLMIIKPALELAVLRPRPWFNRKSLPTSTSTRGSDALLIIVIRRVNVPFLSSPCSLSSFLADDDELGFEENEIITNVQKVCESPSFAVHSELCLDARRVVVREDRREIGSVPGELCRRIAVIVPERSVVASIPFLTSM